MANFFKYKTVYKGQICYTNFLDNKLFILNHEILFLFEKFWSMLHVCIKACKTPLNFLTVNYCGTYKFYGNTKIPGEKLFGG